VVVTNDIKRISFVYKWCDIGWLNKKGRFCRPLENKEKSMFL